MNKQPEITMQTKKNLMDAFWQIYCEKRIEKITVKDITTKAGYNRGTFYEYFADVYDVLEQIEASILPNSLKHKEMMLTTDIHLTLEHLIEVYSRNKKYFVVLLGKNGDPAFQEKVKNEYKTILRQRLQLLDVDQSILEYVLEYEMSAFIGVMTYCFTKEEDPDIKKMIQLLWKIMHSEHDRIIKLIF